MHGNSTPRSFFELSKTIALGVLLLTVAAMRPPDGELPRRSSWQAGDATEPKLLAYDPTRTLVVDPEISFATYLGGSGTDIIRDMDEDADGNIVVTGYTNSNDYPGAEGRLAGSNDVFVAKIDPVSGTLLFSTLIGGSDSDQARSVSIAPDGSIFVIGTTYSADLPTTAGVVQPSRAGESDGFAAKLSAAGTLEALTYLGGASYDELLTGAAASDGSLWAGGWTSSGDFPTTAGALQENCAPTLPGSPARDNDAVVMRLTSDLTQFVVSSCLGGSGADQVNDLALNADGSVLVTGFTQAGDFPVTADALQPSLSGQRDAFLVRLNGGASEVQYGTYYGGSTGFLESADAVDIGDDGKVYVGGTTWADDFPVVNAFQSAAGGSQDGFYLELVPDGAGYDLVLASYVGGAEFDQIYDVSVSTDGRGCFGGYTLAGITLDDGSKISGSGFALCVRDENTGKNSPPFVLDILLDLVGPTPEIEILAFLFSPVGQVFIAGNVFDHLLETRNPIQSASGGEYDGWIMTIKDEGAVDDPGKAILDMQLTVSDPRPILGTRISATLTTTNVGTADADDVEITIVSSDFNVPIPDGCQPGLGVIVCPIGTLASGQKHEMAVSMVVRRAFEVGGKAEGIDKPSGERIESNLASSWIEPAEDIVDEIFVNLRKCDEPNKAADGTIDIYVDGERAADDVACETSTGSIPVTLTTTGPTLDVVDGAAADNSTPIATFDLDFLLDDGSGDVTFSRENAIFITNASDGGAGLIVKNQIRTTAEDPTKAELFFAHGDPDAGAVTLRFPDAGTSDQTLAFGETTSYVAVSPGIHRLEIIDAGTGTVLRRGDVDLREKEGQTFTGGIRGISDPQGPEIRIFNNDGDLVNVDDGGASATISGVVLEDVNYGGGEGRRKGVPRPDATVELYRGDGLIATTTTDANGRYEFDGLAPDGYVVRVVNATVTSSRPQRGGSSAAPLGVQTYRTDASGGTPQPVTTKVGGENPSMVDAGPGGSGASLSGLSDGGVTPQSITTVNLQGDSVDGVDFVFNFDTIVNTNSANQGSLPQFMGNSNALANAGLSQEGHPAGDETSIFMIPAPNDPLGRPADAGFKNGEFIIDIGLPLDVTDKVILNGLTQTALSGDTNPQGPEVKVRGTADYGLRVGVPRIDVAGVTIADFIKDGISGSSALEVKNVGPDDLVVVRDNVQDGISSSSVHLSGNRVILQGNDRHGVFADNDVTIDKAVTAKENDGWGVLSTGGSIKIGEAQKGFSNINRNGRGGISAGGSTIAVREAHITANGEKAAAPFDGRGILGEAADVTLTNVEVNDNKTGGIRAGTVSITSDPRSSVSGNDGHGVYSRGNVTINGDIGVFGNDGWGIVTLTGDVTIAGGLTRSQVTGNERSGINSGGSVTLSNVYVNENGSRGGHGVIAETGTVNATGARFDWNKDGGVRAKNVALTGGTVSGNGGFGVTVLGGFMSINGAQVSGNAAGGFHTTGLTGSGKGGSLEASTIERTNIVGNGGDGIRHELDELLTVTESNIAENTGAGIINASTAGSVDASGVWWGDPTGPDGRIEGDIDASAWSTTPFTVADYDGDGVPGIVEADAPNDGDGNADGVADSTQATVASFAIRDSTYVTLELTSGSTLQNVISRTNPSPDATPDGAAFDHGIPRFDVASPGGSAVVRMLYSDARAIDAVFHYDGRWILFDSDGSTGADIESSTITLHFIDGGRGDGDGEANGRITATIAAATVSTLLAEIIVSPDSVTLRAGDVQVFTAAGIDQLGRSMPVGTSWSATGGSIDADGRFTAGATPGTFIIAAEHASGVRGEAVVEIASGVGVRDDALPAAYALHHAYPNPFNPTTSIGFDVKEPGHVLVGVFDMLGRHVATLVDRTLPAGRHRVDFRADGLPTGLYIYRMKTRDFEQARSVLLTK